MLALTLCAALSGAGASPDASIERLSDDEKIAQLMFVGFNGTVDSPELRQIARERRFGGVVLYAKNIESPAQVKRLTEAISQHTGQHPAPFIAIDQEGGIVRRLSLGVPVIPSAMALGATRSSDLARRAGNAVGTALRELGFTMNFAPVLDVLTSPQNTSLGTRAFGDDPALVADLGAAFIEGQQSAGIIAVGKHFPGIGGIAEDSHKTLPHLDSSAEQLRSRELVPFVRAQRRGMRAVMIGHIALPKIAERGDQPASLSRRVVTELLRGELRFNGIAITDALQMDALARERGYPALALESLLAGSDMVLMLGTAKQREEVFLTLRDAYRDGRLSKARVDEALRRIQMVKMMLRSGTFDSEPSADIVGEIAARAVTRIGDANLPTVTRVRKLVYAGPDGALRMRVGTAIAHLLPVRPKRSESARLAAVLTASFKRGELVIAAASTEEQFEVIRRAHEASPKTPLIFVNLGSPYRVLRDARAITLLMYADDAASQIAAAEVVFGNRKATGVAPVRLPGSPP